MPQLDTLKKKKKLKKNNKINNNKNCKTYPSFGSPRNAGFRASTAFHSFSFRFTSQCRSGRPKREIHLTLLLISKPCGQQLQLSLSLFIQRRSHQILYLVLLLTTATLSSSKHLSLTIPLQAESWSEVKSIPLSLSLSLCVYFDSFLIWVFFHYS